MTEQEHLKKRSFAKEFVLILSIFFFGLFLRLVYVHQYASSPFFDSPIIDALSHYIYSLRLSSGDWFGRGIVAPRAPLYVYFLAIIFKLFGPGYMIPRIIQAGLSAMNCVLVYFLGRKIFSPAVGIISAFTCGAYGVLIYFDAEFLNVTLTIFLNLLLLLALLYTAQRPRFWKWLGCGILFGFSLQTSANVILFFPLMLIWIYFFQSDHFAEHKKKLAAILLVVVGSCLIVLPFALRNYLQGGEFVLVSTTAGINLYIGNNPSADGKSAYAPTRDFSYSGWQDNVLISSEREAERITGKDLTPSEVSRFWIIRTLKFVFSCPLKFISLTVRKFYYFFNGYEIAENQSIYFFRLWSSLLSLLVFSNSFVYFPFGIICPLALLGIAVSFKRDKKIVLLLLFLLAHLLLLLIFFVVSRYRAPVLPYFIIFATYGSLWLIRVLREKRIKTFFLSLIMLAFMFLFCNSNVFGVADEDKSRWFFNLGTAFQYKGEDEKARKSFEQAQKLDPDDLDLEYNLAVLDLKANKYNEAIKRFEQVIKKDPRDSASFTNIGLALSKQARPKEAIAYYKRALEIDAQDIATMVNLGSAYRELGNFEKAQSVFERVYEIDDNYPPLHNHLGVLYEQLNQLNKAEEEYLKAIELKTDYFEVYYNLALLYEKMGLSAKAKEMRSRASEVLPFLGKN